MELSTVFGRKEVAQLAKIHLSVHKSELKAAIPDWSKDEEVTALLSEAQKLKELVDAFDRKRCDLLKKKNIKEAYNRCFEHDDDYVLQYEDLGFENNISEYSVRIPEEARLELIRIAQFFELGRSKEAKNLVLEYQRKWRLDRKITEVVALQTYTQGTDIKNLETEKIPVNTKTAETLTKEQHQQAENARYNRLVEGDEVKSDFEDEELDDEEEVEE